MPIQYLPRIIQWLRGGAEISVARILRRPIAHFQKVQRISRMLGHMSEGELDQILDIARRGINSARQIQVARKVGKIITDEISLQPYLFGDDAGGRRGMADLDVYVPDIGHKVRIRVDWSDPDELLYLKETATAELQRMIDQSPDKFGLPLGYLVDPIEVTVTFAERR